MPPFLLSPVRVLFDANIVIDAAVPARSSHGVALRLISEVDRGRISGLVAPTSLTTCWYVATTHHEVDPRPLFEALEAVFDFALMNRVALREAPGAPEEVDFEDVYLAAAGKEAGAEVVVTRNEENFAGGPLAPYSPGALASMIGS
jgi:predicted nucleic acid-binding protein